MAPLGTDAMTDATVTYDVTVCAVTTHAAPQTTPYVALLYGSVQWATQDDECWISQAP